jgi:hypothetical protein
MAALLCISACHSGGGDSGSSPPADSGANTGWAFGLFQPSARFAAQCAVPRSGTNPQTGAPYADVQGSILTQNNWLRSWSNELYLWYDEIADTDPGVSRPAEYFNLLKTFRETPSGTPKDKFHFTYPTEEWIALSQSGVEAGYGAEFTFINSAPPRQVVVAYTQPNSPATASGIDLQRGATILSVDGVDLVRSTTPESIAVLNAGLFPAQPGQSHTFTIRDRGSVNTRTITMQSAVVTLSPVQHVRTVPTITGQVGYLLFTDHIATSEQALVDAITALRAANITDLVLDIRYNGGGFLDIASELAFMIAGSARSAGQTFEDIRFNDKHPATNPVTGAPLRPMPFHSTAGGFSAAPGLALPTLDLPRVFVLTGANTCSASESIINGLRGIGVEVIQVGATTCGKPYGFYPADNCGTTYFSIQMKGVNALGFGDYTDGFAPSNTRGLGGTRVPGCAVADDFTHALGDELEGRLAAALRYRLSQSCPAPPSGSSATTQLSKPSVPGLAPEGIVAKSPWLQNRTVREP